MKTILDIIALVVVMTVLIRLHEALLRKLGIKNPYSDEQNESEK